MTTFYGIRVRDEFLLDEQVRAQLPCEHCKTWGRTLTESDEGKIVPVFCPECKRPTWPNLGVNLPAGAAVSQGGSNLWMEAGTAAAKHMAVELREREKQAEIDRVVGEAFKGK